MNSNDKMKAEQSYLEELLRQVSTQSALIAGFSFAGLTIDPTVNTNAANLSITILVSIAMGLNILALCISGLLLAAFKFNPEMSVKWKTHFDLCWSCYLFGLTSFLFSLPFIVYVRIPVLVIPSIIFTLTIFIIASLQFQVIFKKTKS